MFGTVHSTEHRATYAGPSPNFSKVFAGVCITNITKQFTKVSLISSIALTYVSGDLPETLISNGLLFSEWEEQLHL
jgi:hypothetical protein